MCRVLFFSFALSNGEFLARYNGKEHPIPFHKAQDLGKAPKKIAGGAVPDLEEAIDVSLAVKQFGNRRVGLIVFCSITARRRSGRSSI